ncbi:MAG: ABC transporter permease [Planctomycetia bacterium]|nr:ABC transporter permease [Planctomycetia bacterium]
MTPSPSTRRADPPGTPSRPPGGFRASAWFALFRVSVRQFVRGRRLLALAGLFLLPTAIALLGRHYDPGFRDEVDRIEELLVFYMIPQALVPLTALILASGMIRDEVEGQTLTYLLIRPLPRPSIYAAKLLAAWCVSAALAAVFITAAMAAVRWGSTDFWGGVIPGRAWRVSALSAVSLLVYVALFGGAGLVVRWVLPLGVGYIVVFEGLFANIDFMVRRATVLYHVRVLSERWLGLHVESWTIDLAEAPGGNESLWTLLTAAAVLGAAGAWLFGRQEIRLKTPEGG